MRELSKKITDFFVQKNVIQEDEYAVYQYGVEILFENISVCVFLLMCGMVLHKVCDTILFLGIFVGVRRYSGGYHANTRTQCHLITLTAWGLYIFSTVMYRQFCLIGRNAGIVLSMLVCLALFFLAPVENAKKPLLESVKCRNRRITRLLASCFLLLECCVWSRLPEFAFACLAILIEVVLLMIWAKVRR